MNALIQTGFDYAALPIDAALNARAAAERIKLRLKRTVEDIIEIGRELKEVKPRLDGVFGKWFENETGLAREMADKFIGVYEKFGGGMLNNLAQPLSPTVLYLLSAPSTPESVIDKAIEKADSGEKVTVADVKDWKAELEEERQARLTAEQRNADWAAQNKADRDKLKALELDLLTAKSQTAPEPKKIEVIPPDYETAKAKAAQLESELAKIRKEQDRLINSQVKAKLHEYQSEVDTMEQKKRVLEDQVTRMKDYLASLEGESRRIEVHQQVIEEQRLKLISLAAFLSDEEPMHNADTAKRWRALGDMLNEAYLAVSQYTGDAKPSLTVIHGRDAA